MKIRLSFCLLLLSFLISCTFSHSSGEAVPEHDRYLRLQAFIHRVGSPGFNPVEGERMYPFTYALRKAEGGEIVRHGEGYVLINEPLWCLFQRWRDPNTGNPGQRMFIVDRNKKKFEAEVRQWPEGSQRQRWNHWTCIRFPDSSDESFDIFRCEYYLPEGIELISRKAGSSLFYKEFFWNGNGLLTRINRLTKSSAQYLYDGLKLKRIEFREGEAIRTFAEFTYE